MVKNKMKNKNFKQTSSLLFLIIFFFLTLDITSVSAGYYKALCRNCVDLYPGTDCPAYVACGNDCFSSLQPIFGTACDQPQCWYDAKHDAKPASCPDECLDTTLRINGFAECKAGGWQCTRTNVDCGNVVHTNCQSQACGGTPHYCTYDGSNWQWRTSKPAEDCDDGVDNDCDGLTDCADHANCDGQTGPGGHVCCEVDNDCKNAGVTCDAQGYPHRYARCTANTCTICGQCLSKTDCENDYCCSKEIGATTGECKYKHTIMTSGGKSYVCDPPSGFSVTDSQISKPNPIVEFFNFIISAIKNLF